MWKEWTHLHDVGARRKEKYYDNHNHMHYNVLGDVGMRYSHPVMFHVFIVVKRRENRATMNKDN